MKVVVAVVLVAIALTREAVGHDDDFACYKCKKSYSEEQCNAQGITYCKSKEQSCVTIEEEKKDGIEIEKKCIDPSSKYCREQPYCKGSGDSKCYYCCYEPLCNAHNPQPKDPCECKPCLNGGTCTASEDGTSFTCQCTADYTGSYCENLVEREDPCDSNPCQHGGTCRSIGDEVDCDCPPAYSGQYCEIVQDPCGPENPCMNGGECWASGDAYRCECPDGFSGEHCEKEDHPCASSPCQNGGTCTPHCTGYTCLCLPGFTGRNCETPAEECLRCPSEFGLYADPFDCTMFYHCSHWVPYHKNCPHPLHFNDFLDVCDWPENAKCVPGTEPDDWDLMQCMCMIDQTIPPEDDEGPNKREEEEEVGDEIEAPEDGAGVESERLEEILQKISEVINELDHDVLHND